jgi:hypothetical protein
MDCPVSSGGEGVNWAMMGQKSIPNALLVGIRMGWQCVDFDLTGLLHSNLSEYEYGHVAEAYWKPRQNELTHFGFVLCYEILQTCVFGNVASCYLDEKIVMDNQDTSMQSSFPQYVCGCGVLNVH